MLRQVMQFLLDVTLQPLAVLFLLRFHLQWLRAPLRNQVGAMVMSLTDFAVLKLRRSIPAWRGLDSSSLLLAWIAELAYLAMTMAVSGSLFLSTSLGLVLWAALSLLRISIYLLMGSLFIGAMLSWLSPYSPLAPMLAAINRPFLSSLRQRLPMPGNVDFSPMLALIVCQLLLMVPVAWLERWVLLVGR